MRVRSCGLPDEERTLLWNVYCTDSDSGQFVLDAAPDPRPRTFPDQALLICACVQEDLWRIIARQARAQGVQIFATAQSIDTLSSLYAASSVEQDCDIRLIRLELARGEPAATTYGRSDLAGALREHIVRAMTGSQTAFARPSPGILPPTSEHASQQVLDLEHERYALSGRNVALRGKHVLSS